MPINSLPDIIQQNIHKIKTKDGSKIVVILGPTASGKSNLGIFLARKFGGEIISADSRQVYREMDIGTGKVKRDSIRYKVLSIKGEKINSKFYSEGIRHHLIDVTSPKKVFTVSDFKNLGEKAIKEILIKNKVPFIVGGTGFYIDVLLGRMSVAEVPPNKKLRAELSKQSTEHLFSRLLTIDPRRAKTIDQKNKRRLIRALEIIDSIGKVPVLNTKYGIHNTKYDVLWLGLKPKNIEKRIKLRLQKRLQQGMVHEVKNLLNSGVSKKRLHDFGLEYRQISEYLASEKTEIPGLKHREPSPSKVKSEKNFKKSEYYKKLLREIIKYSKRQMTWFKRNKEIHWIKSEGEAEKLTKKFISPR